MRVLVVHPPTSIARDFIDYPYFADLGAVQVAASLRAAGHEVSLVDAYALPGSTLAWREDGRAHLGASVDELVAACPNADVAVVVTTPFHRPGTRDDVLAAVLEGLRERHARLILIDAYQSGQHYVEADVLAHYPEADAWLKYEAEVSLLALLEEGKGVFVGEEAELDALPLPAWDLIDLEALFRFHARTVAGLGRPHWAFPIGSRALPMVTSRGCPFRCLHCSSNPGRAQDAPKTQRRFSAEKLAERISDYAALGSKTIHVLDELVNVRKSHFDGLLDCIEEHDLRFEVPNGFRADYLEAAHFGRMRGRVTTVSVSAESGSARVVSEVVGKQLDLGCIERAAENARKASVPLLVHYMIGLPGETAEEVNETLAYALDLFDRFGAEPAVQFATPLPGTPLAEKMDAAQVRTLPILGDWGPRFQQAPSGSAIDEATLATFRRTFDRRMEASRGANKLVMNVTYVCNNHCTFCAVGTRTQVDGHPTRQREILDKYRRHGITMVDFDGGEPTLNPELVALVRHARRVGYERVNVTTNGRLLAYEEFAQKLVTSGLTTLLFSVHGPDVASHAREVGVAEAFGQTTAGIRHAMKHRPEHVEVGMNVTLTKTNFRRLPDLAQLAWDHGLRWLNVQFLTPFGRATTQHAPDTSDAARVTSSVIDDWRDRMRVQVINLPWCFMPEHEDNLVGDSQKLARHMVFVNNETVNLAAYLAERRVRKPECEPCAYRSFCGGFYQLEDVPEPEWLVTAESLVRPVAPGLDVR